MQVYSNTAELFVLRKIAEPLIAAYIADRRCVSFATSSEKVFLRPDELVTLIALLNRMEQCAELQRPDKTYLRFVIDLAPDGSLRKHRFIELNEKKIIADYVRSTEQEGD